MSISNEHERSIAVERATHAADDWKAATSSEQYAAPDLAHFYALTGELVDTLQRMSRLCVILRNQVGGYGEGRTLRDDEPGHDPAQRLASAYELAHLLRHDLDSSERTAQRFWFELGHIAVEVTP